VFAELDATSHAEELAKLSALVLAGLVRVPRTHHSKRASCGFLDGLSRTARAEHTCRFNMKERKAPSEENLQV